MAEASSIKASLLATILPPQFTIPLRRTERAFFPEVNDGAAPFYYGSYRHNSSLLGYATVLLAYNMAVYHFPNGADQHPGRYSVPIVGEEPRDMPPALPFNSGINAEPRGVANMYCSLADASDGEIDFASESQYSFNYHVHQNEDSGQVQMLNSQAAIYHWVRQEEILITVAFRGSETFSVHNIAGANMHQLIGDWLGADLNLAPVADRICHDPNVQIHNGVQNAYLIMGHDIITKLQELLRQMRAGHPSKPIKIFVTGHSLGAALADMFTYDLSCGGTNAEGLGQPLAGTITFGHFAH